MIVTLIEKVCRREDLSRDEMSFALGQLIAGECGEAQMAGLLVGMRVKGESVEEVVGAAKALRDRSIRLPVSTPPMLDTCGTGGDGARSVNLSTAAALIASSLGVTVAKHYNRSISSICGSADVLEALGVPIDQSPERTAEMVDRCGIGFMFAPAYHPATRAVAQLRRALGVRTLFNILGPLTNPAGVKAQLTGVYHPDRTLLMGEALRELGCERALVVSAECGLDEIAPTGPTVVADLRGRVLRQYKVTPADFGAPEMPLDSIRGGSPEVNAAALRDILSGADHPARVAVLLNTSAALVAADSASDFRDGYQRAAAALDTGIAAAKLAELIAFAQAPA